MARASAALLVRGRLESVAGVRNLIADQLAALRIVTLAASRDFR